MSDGEDVNTKVAVPKLAPSEMDIYSALQVVLKKALIHDGVTRGIRETVKAIEKRQACLVLLADDCNEPSYQRLIEALAKEAKIQLLRVPQRATLGEWAGLNRMRKTGEIKKAIGSSVVAIRQYGETSDELTFTLNYIKNRAAAASS